MKTLQNLQEDTCAKAVFHKFTGLRPAKAASVFSSKFFEIVWNTFFMETSFSLIRFKSASSTSKNKRDHKSVISKTFSYNICQRWTGTDEIVPVSRVLVNRNYLLSLTRLTAVCCFYTPFFISNAFFQLSLSVA